MLNETFTVIFKHREFVFTFSWSNGLIWKVKFSPFFYLTLDFFSAGLENSNEGGGGVANGNAAVVGSSRTLSSHHQTFNISNEVFEEEELSSRTVSEYDKISTITEVRKYDSKKISIISGVSLKCLNYPKSTQINPKSTQSLPRST